PRSRRRLWPAAAVAVAVVAAAAALLLAGPFGSGPSADVQAQALAALGGRGSVLEVVERIASGPARGFVPSPRPRSLRPPPARVGRPRPGAGGRGCGAPPTEWWSPARSSSAAASPATTRRRTPRSSPPPARRSPPAAPPPSTRSPSTAGRSPAWRRPRRRR